MQIGVVNVDPLTRGTDASRELFTRFSREAGHGFDYDAVIGAAGNVLLNALRQSCPNRKDADEAFSRLVAKLREALHDHYDVAGNRRSVFPFNQVIQMPFLKNLKKTATVHRS